MTYFISASLFPSPVTPHTGLFVWHRLTALQKIMPNQKFFVVSPTPYFPFKHPIFGHYSDYARKPKGVIHYQGFDVCYPRYGQIPLTASRYSGYLTYLSILGSFQSYLRTCGSLPKVLIAEYGFPDSIALYHLSKKYQIPYCVTLRGSDLSFFMKLKSVYSQMVQSLDSAQALICVSNDMVQEIKNIYNVHHHNIHALSNGVNSDIFTNIPSSASRAEYKITTPYLVVSVGGLIKRKNHSLAIQAMVDLPDTSLIIVGSGEEYQTLSEMIAKLNLKNRVFLVGSKSQHEIAKLYSASDVFLLCSRSEGRPNVVLEALACGTPALSSDVQGINELITHRNYGQIFPQDISASELSGLIKTMVSEKFDADIIQSHGQSFSWEKCAKEYAQIIENCTKK